MATESGEEENVELIDGDGDEETSYMGEYPLFGVTPKGVESELNEIYVLGSDTDEVVRRENQWEFILRAYNRAKHQKGMGVGKAQIEAWEKANPKGDIFDWNNAYMGLNKIEEKVMRLKNLYKSLRLLIYGRGRGQIKNKWLTDYYNELKKEDGGYDSDPALERGDWENLLEEVKSDFDMLAGELRDSFAIPILKHEGCTAINDAHVRHMTLLRRKKPEEAAKMEAIGRGFR